MGYPLYTLFIFLIVSMNADSLSTTSKMRILCLHGRMQSGSIFANKIGGARRKLERVYDLTFLDGPILLDGEQKTYGWWNRDEKGVDVGVQEALQYVLKATSGQRYDALLGFSQGGTLATSLALTGAMPSVCAVVTAGAPFVEEAFRVAKEISQNENTYKKGLEIPKFHLAGERDDMISVESTRKLSEEGGNGSLEVHEKGHLFPTRSASVTQVLEFLEQAVAANAEQG